MNERHDPIVQALSQLQPRSPGVSREQLLYEAGRTAARRQCRRWQTISAVLAIGCITAAVAIFSQGNSSTAPQARTVAMRAHATRPSSTPANGSARSPVKQLTAAPGPQPFTHWLWSQIDQSPPVESEQARYIQIRNAVIEHGTRALPGPPNAAHSDRSQTFATSDTSEQQAIQAILRSNDL